MVAFNFTVFIDKIERGEKLQTIRSVARCRPGDRLQLYTGQRTKECRLIGMAVCTAVERCVIGGSFERKNADAFAQADGFASYSEMVAWFQKKYNVIAFCGYRIKWRLV